DGAPLPPFRATDVALAELQAARGAQLSATLATDTATYDRLRLGDPFALRVLRLGGALSLVRPAGAPARGLLPWGALVAALAALALALLGWRQRRTRPGQALLALLGLAALAFPLVQAYQEWRVRDDLSGATARASANVLDATRVTEVSLLPDDVRGVDRHQVPRPYDVVQLQLQPPGYPDAVLAVLAVDAVDADGDPLEQGAEVQVAYAPDDPHGARILGRTRTHYWRTTLGIYADEALRVGALVALALAIAVLQRRLRRGTLPPQPTSV